MNRKIMKKDVKLGVNLMNKNDIEGTIKEVIGLEVQTVMIVIGDQGIIGLV